MTAEARLRAGTLDDVRAMDVLVRAANPPPAGEPPMPEGAMDAYLRYLVQFGTAAVAELDGVVIGFGVTIFTGRTTHLADLFVAADHQGQGHGGRLVSAVFGDRWPRTTFASEDPRAMPLYIRAGMAPIWPNLYVSGDPSALPMAEGMVVERASVEDVARLDGEWGAVDRSTAVELWRALPDVRPYVVMRAGRPVAACVGRRRLNGTGRVIDRARVAPGEPPILPLLAAIRQGAEGEPRIALSVLGPSPLLPVLLGARFQIRDRDTFMASEPGLVDPVSELANNGIP